MAKTEPWLQRWLEAQPDALADIGGKRPSATRQALGMLAPIPKAAGELFLEASMIPSAIRASENLRAGKPVMAGVESALALPILGVPGRGAKPLAKALLKQIAEQGGFSMRMASGELIEKGAKGFAVGLGSEKKAILSKAKAELTEKDIEAFLKQHKELLDEPNAIIGGWVDDKGVVHIEPSEIVKSRSDAVRLGAERKQQAVWDFSKGEEISTAAPSGMRKLRHFSPKEGLTQLEAKYMSTGPVLGAERIRTGRPPMMHFYDEGAKPDVGYKGLPEYTTEVDAKSVYDIRNDPEGIVRRSVMQNKGFKADLVERAVQKAGYAGYENSEYPGTIKLFNKKPIPVKRVGGAVADSAAVGVGRSVAEMADEAEGMVTTNNRLLEQSLRTLGVLPRERPLTRPEVRVPSQGVKPSTGTNALIDDLRAKGLLADSAVAGGARALTGLPVIDAGGKVRLVKEREPVHSGDVTRREYVFKMPNGTEVEVVGRTIDDDFRVDWMGVPGEGGFGKDVGTAGPAAMRQLGRQIKELTGAKTISGERITGARPFEDVAKEGGREAKRVISDSLYRGVPAKAAADFGRPNAQGALFTTPDKSLAKQFTSPGTKEPGAVGRSTLAPGAKIFDGTNPDHVAQIGMDDADELWHSSRASSDEVIAKVRAAGFDGMRVRDGRGAPEEIAVLNTEKMGPWKAAASDSLALIPRRALSKVAQGTGRNRSAAIISGDPSTKWGSLFDYKALGKDVQPVEQAPLPRAKPVQPGVVAKHEKMQEKATERLRSPEVMDLLDKGLMEKGHLFYYQDQLARTMMDLLGEKEGMERFTLWNKTTAATSAASDMRSNIRRAGALFPHVLQGTSFNRIRDLNAKLAPGLGNIAANSAQKPALARLAKGSPWLSPDPDDLVKMDSFWQNLGGNFSPGTIDRHANSLTGLPKSAYAPAEGAFKTVADELAASGKLEVPTGRAATAPFQAGVWIGDALEGRVKSPPVPALSVLEQGLRETANLEGINVNEALRRFIRGNLWGFAGGAPGLTRF